ncbi:MAG TPA: hypothetical protein VJP05_04505 [Acidimicrobiia bacterium]|nr:hypothetical protein [Acidimicrobiia bacterium]
MSSLQTTRPLGLVVAAATAGAGGVATVLVPAPGLLGCAVIAVGVVTLRAAGRRSAAE